MSILINNGDFTVQGDVALNECFNLKPIMAYVDKVHSAVKELNIEEMSDEFKAVVKDCCGEIPVKDIHDFVTCIYITDMEELIKKVYKPVYEALHDKYVKATGNASANLAQENSFRQSILLSLALMNETECTVQLCTVLDETDRLYPKSKIVNGFKLYNSFLVTKPLEARMSSVISTSDFDLVVTFNK